VPVSSLLIERVPLDANHIANKGIVNPIRQWVEPGNEQDCSEADYVDAIRSKGIEGGR
jgi:hypothetical protein